MLLGGFLIYTACKPCSTLELIFHISVLKFARKSCSIIFDRKTHFQVNSDTECSKPKHYFVCFFILFLGNHPTNSNTVTYALGYCQKIFIQLTY
jgi:hypothetical protein